MTDQLKRASFVTLCIPMSWWRWWLNDTEKWKRKSQEGWHLRQDQTGNH